ncbi:hypothetical protein SAMN04488503_0225 [Humidesulfovibrio mexicanus]|uniref:Uncharacterized protein n=1 Tax=Humidesulfovibrio mexicanus TaxID=147047 RepID=A0A238XK77_9BACT|nr:hypothetical protein [Humidesulfovibrio mexicanus]SNR59405.1 hypothetical protein SAMN04488503_0225 [Humidesulfovibrio mexicanus]
MTWHGLPALRALSSGPLLTAELSRAVGISLDSTRAVCRCLRARGLMRTVEGIHELTEAGHQAVACGQEITCGPNKGGVRRAESLRAKAWRAMRIKMKFSLDELLSLLCDGEEKDAEGNLRRYLRTLELAGYLVEMKRTGADGSRRWWLAKDTGLHAPAWNKKAWTLTDANTGESHDLRQFKEKRPKAAKSHAPCRVLRESGRTARARLVTPRATRNRKEEA